MPVSELRREQDDGEVGEDVDADVDRGEQDGDRLDGADVATPTESTSSLPIPE